MNQQNIVKFEGNITHKSRNFSNWLYSDLFVESSSASHGLVNGWGYLWSATGSWHMSAIFYFFCPIDGFLYQLLHCQLLSKLKDEKNVTWTEWWLAIQDNFYLLVRCRESHSPLFEKCNIAPPVPLNHQIFEHIETDEFTSQNKQSTMDNN